MAFSPHRDIRRFDRWASRYDRSWTQRIFFRPLYRRTLDIVTQLAPAAEPPVLQPQPFRILDVGCGTGGFLRLAAARFRRATLTGLDASKKMIDRAREANPWPERLTFVHGRAEDLPFEDAQFDMAVSTMSFHHWADQAKGLGEVSRVLRSHAPFLLADHFIIASHRPFYAGRSRSERFHTPREIDRMLTTAGFEACQWHDLYKIGPLLIVAGVTARKKG